MIKDDVQQIFGFIAGANQAKAWVQPLAVACERFQINTPRRIAAFIAQLAHESANFSTLSENLNYSADALRRVFPKYFTTAAAEKFGRTTAHSADCVMIASIAYANRMGNGDVESMDGWKYRGRGPIQLTGKNNYKAAGLALGLDLISKPDLVAAPEVGALVAAWFWDQNHLNTYADAGNIDSVSDIINLGRLTPTVGDALGYKERLALTNKGLEGFARGNV